LRVFIKIQKKRKNYFSVKLKILKSIQVKNLIRRIHKIGLFKMERKSKKGKSKFWKKKKEKK
tara:strand:+ start:46 stop:231 length:186 start_codon:yes stop_codon:yes gene_type:complete